MEADLYPAVKAFLQAQGYDVKAEICGCDVVATRADEPPLIVELKRVFNLALLLQGIDRLSLTDRVYLAVARPPRRQRRGGSVYRRDVQMLCRRVGLGLLTVAALPTRGRVGSLASFTGREARLGHRVEVLLDPVPYAPRKRVRRLARLLGEHARRAGDPNRGGVSRTPIMTAYRQEALRCAILVDRAGRETLAGLRASGLVPHATKIVQRDVYGWFERVARATYAVTERARQDIARFAAAGVLPALDPPALPDRGSDGQMKRPGGEERA